MDRMSQGCKGKAPLPFQLIPTAHLIHLNLPFPPMDCTVDGTDLLSVPLALSLYIALSSFLVAPDIFMAHPRLYKAVLNALSLHQPSIFSLTPPQPSHDQSKSFLDLTSQDNSFRTLLKLD
ncbi:hypothetical protein IGI04_040409 [Brassica rapa subsp. trilocularis]|uniref:Uncharacterized protein n=1 Tax=Brassica rapa subsp. trilocularis TaxID=1813537 RepID=A0ABQ7KNJ5_BRACM|nr:hypothetical protein IGI04_042843 [Brassica rapa subsp. trilocularis]KAG5373873.1 hypothetical protein IGI04_042814 [Brassica rapa subsp. trilocularis]KAG5375813.1 hypothetical protein IGI04_040409 [Brassica rapa subsp. trilocularis]